MFSKNQLINYKKTSKYDETNLSSNVSTRCYLCYLTIRHYCTCPSKVQHAFLANFCNNHKILLFRCCSAACFWMGQDTLRVPMRMFINNREKLCTLLRDTGEVPDGSIVLLEGGKQEMRYCSDHEPVFRQVGTVYPIKGEFMLP